MDIVSFESIYMHSLVILQVFSEESVNPAISERQKYNKL